MMKENKLAVTGALFVGGESRRMGENKAFLKMGETTLIERSLNVLNGIFETVVISARESEPYERFGYPVITDRIKGKGPLGGLYSILPKAEHDYVFIVACDMPFLEEEGIRSLYGQLGDFDAIVPSTQGRIHPLHAFYHKRILPLVEQSIFEDRLKIVEVLGQCRTKIVDMEINKESFINVNTPNDWDKALHKTN